MAFRPKSYEFDVDGTYTTGVSTLTFNYTAGTATIDTLIVQITDLTNIRVAINELITQPTGDGVDDNKKTTAGGVTIVWNVAPAETIVIATLGAMAKNKAISLVNLLIALGH